ncbi:unnamed protein product [Boreogadus saida]
MKSDHSMDHPPEFKDGRPSREERRRQERADSPGPSCVSMKSDHSMDHPPEFKDGRPSREERSGVHMNKVVMSLKDGGGLYMEEFSRHRAEEAFST